MRMRAAALWTALAGLLSAVAAQQSENVTLTACGLSCLVETVPKVNCTLLDTACVCKSTALPPLVASCLLDNCTMHDQLQAAKFKAHSCNSPHPNRSNEPIILTAAIYTITTVLIVLRLISKIWVSRTMGIEDWVLTFAHVILFASTYFVIKMSKRGFGKHLWDLQDGDLLLILRDFYIAENAYVIAISLAKISVVALYLRLFDREPYFRFFAYLTIACIFATMIILSSLFIFTCSPVPYFWNRDIAGGKCMNVQVIAFASGAMSIVQDVVILILPLPVIAKLNMDRKKKWGVGFMLALGSAGAIVSMIRLKSLTSFNTNVDPSFDNVDVVIWTILELAAAMICASLPALRVLYIRLKTKTTNSFNRGPTSEHSFASKAWHARSASRRANQVSTEGLVELQLAESEDRRDEPPRVPPKDTFLITESGYSVNVVGGRKG